jgi:hypothetical protein
MKLGKKNKAKEPKNNDDFLAEEAKQSQETALDYTLDIPEDEIWTYQIEGLQAPHVNKPFKNAKRNKIIVVIVLLIAISASIFLSVWAVHNDLYEYKELDDGTYELVKFSNTGDITDVTIDYVVDLKTGERDTTKPITVIDEYAFNCDETLNTIRIGKDIKSIDGKSIYSCWYVQNVFIDEDNPYYCDLDGVIYNKDLTEVLFYPNDHDKALRLENGYAEIGDDDTQHSLLVDDDGNEMEELWGTTKKYDEEYYQQYNRNCRTYVIPSTVTTIGELAFAYSNIVDLYIPEGVTRMENMAIFKNTVLTNIYSYKTDSVISDTTYKAIDSMSEIYASLPEGLEFIGSDCLYYARGLTYLYIPSSIKEIKHHAFWDAVYKEDKELNGITAINIGTDEESFKANCTTGDQWRPQYDYMLFKKSIDVNYSAERQSQYASNVNREYYWAVQWIINNKSEEVKNNSSYLVQDLNNDGTPELVLRQYDEKTKKLTDKVLTFKYGYLYDYNGKMNYSSSTFSSLDDNTQLDAILTTVE